MKTMSIANVSTYTWCKKWDRVMKTSNWITENFKCPSPMVSKPKTPSVADFLSYFIIDGYAQKLGTCFVPVNVHVNQYSDRI